MASKKVSTVVTSNSSWYADLIRDIFVPEDADKILSHIPPSPSRQDTLIWCPAKYVKLSVKSCYNHLFSNNDIAHTTMLNWKFWWKMKLSSRLLLLGWKTARACIPNKMNLSAKNIPIQDDQDTRCYLCKTFPETTFHQFYECEVTRAIVFAVVNLRLDNYPWRRTSGLLKFCQQALQLIYYTFLFSNTLLSEMNYHTFPILN